MNASLAAFITLYRFSTGRRLYALRLLLQHARALDMKRLAEYLEKAIAHDEGVRNLESRWRTRPGKGRPEARATDNQIGSGSLSDHAASFLTSCRSGLSASQTPWSHRSLS